MVPKIPWKSLSKEDSLLSKWGPISTKWGTFSAKQVAFFGAVGVLIVVGIALRAGEYFGEPEQKAPVTIQAPSSPDATRPAPSATTPAPAPEAAPAASVLKTAPPAQEAPSTQPADRQAESVEQTEPASGETVDQAAPANLPDEGTILVSKRPVEVLSGPSATSSVMYGFPAGRQFRVVGRQGDFAQIKDVVSGANGWINEAALAEPPSMPAVTSPSRSQPGAAGGTRVTGPADAKPKAKRDSQATAESAEPAEPRKRPGLFGGGGPFRGIFGGN